MGVRIHEARRHHETIGIELAIAGVIDGSHGNDPTFVHGYIRLPSRRTSAVDDGPTSNYHVNHPRRLPSIVRAISSLRGYSVVSIVPSVRMRTQDAHPAHAIPPGNLSRLLPTPKEYP